MNHIRKKEADGISGETPDIQKLVPDKMLYHKIEGCIFSLFTNLLIRFLCFGRLDTLCVVA